MVDDGRTPEHGYTISSPVSLRHNPLHPSFSRLKWGMRGYTFHVHGVPVAKTFRILTFDAKCKFLE